MPNDSTMNENENNFCAGDNSTTNQFPSNNPSPSILNVRDFCNNLTQSLSKELLKNGINGSSGDVVDGIGLDRRQLGTLLDRPDFQALLRLHKLVSAHRTKNVQASESDASNLLDDFVRSLDEEEQKLATTTSPTGATTSKKSMTNEEDELKRLLDTTQFRSLLNAHDRVARKEFEPCLPDVPYEVDEDEGCAMKIVRLVKNNEPLGATIKQLEGSGDLVIARIMHGGSADRSGCIQVGDRVVEVNGVNVIGKQPSDVVKLLSTTGACGTVTFKLIACSYSTIPGHPNASNVSGSTLTSSADVSSPEGRIRVRALFDYQPTHDHLNPCPEAGVAFKKGDILLVVDANDAFWWQARHENDPVGRVGLIPSKQLQEKRIAYAQQQKQNSPGSEKSSLSGGGARKSSAGSRKVRRIMYETRAADDYERDELKTYEEVARLYPRSDLRRPIVLIGAPGVGRNELKRRLILMSPDRFGTTVPHTSRPAKQGETPGVEYHFTSRTQMEQWAREGRFIEFGEYKGNLYGTTVDSVRAVLSMGRICVLNPHPQAIRILRSPELKPYIVNVRPPPFPTLKATRQSQRVRSTFDPSYSRGFTDDELERMVENAKRLERAYGSYFDYVLINEHLDTAFKELLDALARLDTQSHWVPLTWVR